LDSVFLCGNVTIVSSYPAGLKHTAISGVHIGFSSRCVCVEVLVLFEQCNVQIFGVWVTTPFFRWLPRC